MAFTTVLANVSNMVIVALASDYGDTAVAAYGIVKRLDQFPLGISLGLSQGVMPLIAYNYASGDHTRMRKVSVFSWILAACVSALFAVFAVAVCAVLFADGAASIAKPPSG